MCSILVEYAYSEIKQDSISYNLRDTFIHTFQEMESNQTPPAHLTSERLKACLHVTFSAVFFNNPPRCIYMFYECSSHCVTP